MNKNYAGADLSTLRIDPAIAEAAAIRLAPKSAPITKDEAVRTGKEFAARVRSELDKDALVFVFGSTVRGKAHLHSDIDIAVVSKSYGDDVIKGCVLLGAIADDVSWDIEVHTVAESDWRDGDLHTAEIRKWGVSV